MAIVGMAVHYAGCGDKKAFWKLLTERRAGTAPIKASRLRSENKDLHVGTARSKYADTLTADLYGTIDGDGVTSEYELLRHLARDALKDSKITDPCA